jgi:aspartate/glutamate racemase
MWSRHSRSGVTGGDVHRDGSPPAPQQQFTAVVARLRHGEGVDGVILGGTELPLLLTAATIADLPALDTTALHVAAIVRRLWHPHD